MKFAWIKEHRDSFPVNVMCRVLQSAEADSTSGSTQNQVRELCGESPSNVPFEVCTRSQIAFTEATRLLNC